MANKLNNFGELLKQARLAKFPTQKAAAEEITRLGRKISQGLVAQWEAGNVVDPDPEMLGLLSRAFDVDYMTLVLSLVRDKYGAADPQTPPNIAECRWELWEAALKRFPTVGKVDADVDSLEEHQLRTKAAFLRYMEVFDMDGMVEWQKNFPDLKELWILVPDFQDEKEPIRSMVISHLKKGVRLLYFVRQESMDPGGTFWFLQRKLAKDLNKKVVERLTKGIPLTPDEESLLNTNIIIANPTDPENAVGFRILRFESRDPAPGQGTIERRLAFAVRIADGELEGMLRLMSPLVAKKLGEQQVDQDSLVGGEDPVWVAGADVREEKAGISRKK